MATLMSLNCNRLFSQEKDCFVIFNCKELSQFISRKQHFNTANNSITITNKTATKTNHALYMWFLKRSKHSMGMKCNRRKTPAYATNRSTAVNKIAVRSVVVKVYYVFLKCIFSVLKVLYKLYRPSKKINIFSISTSNDTSIPPPYRLICAFPLTP